MGFTIEIGAATELVTVVKVDCCDPFDQVTLDGSGKLAFTDTSTLEIDGRTFQSPAVISGRVFGFGVVDTVDDGSVNNYDDSYIVQEKPDMPDT